MTTENWIEFFKIVLPFLSTLIVTGGGGILLFRHQMRKLKEEILNTAANTKKTEAEEDKEKADAAAVYQEMVIKEANNAVKKSDTISAMSLKIENLTQELRDEKEARLKSDRNIENLNIELDKEKKERLAAASELQDLKLLSDELSAKQEKKIIKLEKRVKDLEDILRDNNLPIPLEVVE